MAGQQRTEQNLFSVYGYPAEDRGWDSLLDENIGILDLLGLTKLKHCLPEYH